MHVGGNASVSIGGPIAKLDLKKLTIGIISDCRQSGRLHEGKFHDCGLSFAICGFRLRFRSPRAAAISFQRAMVVSSPTAGAIASRTRWKANWNSRHRLRSGGFLGQIVAPGGNSAPDP